MASLLTLPLELLVAVSSYLTTPDLGALRLTCKQTEKSLFEWFAGEFFTKKQFMLTYKSLQAFVDISKHVSFSKKLTHVIIATNTYREIPLRFRDSEQAERYVQGEQDQNVLLSTGICLEMLTEAFQNLENLHTVGIRDFNNDKRHRDGVGASWSSWGATTVYTETGIELQFADSSHRMPQHGVKFASLAYQNLIYALGKARRRPQELEVLLRRSLLRDSAFYIPEFLQPTVDPVLHELKTLLLRVDVIDNSIHTHTNGTVVDMKSGYRLRRFLGHTPNLTHLRLNLQTYNITENEDFLRWLALPPSIPTSSPTAFFDPPPIALQSLAKLEFGQFKARANIILDVFSKFAPTLRDISLWRMTLVPGTGPSYALEPNLWATFFSKLARMPQLKLNSLKAGMLSQGNDHVQFKDLTIKDAPALTSKEYTGNNMDAFLQELMEEVFVVSLPWAPDDGDEDLLMHLVGFDDEGEDQEDGEDDDIGDGE